MFTALGLRRWGGVWESPGVKKLGVLGVGASGPKRFSGVEDPAHRVQCPIARPAALLTRRAKGLESRPGFQFRPQQRLGNWSLGGP